MYEFFALSLGLLALSVMTGGLAGWGFATARLARGMPLLPGEPRRQVPWGLLDLLIIIVLSVVVALALGYWLQQAGVLSRPEPGGVADVATLRAATFADSLLKIVLVIVTVATLMVFRGTTLRDLGWSWPDALSDLRTGAIAFAMLAPAVFALQAILVQFFPSQHPLIEMLKKNQDVSLLAIVAFSAAIVAPLAEELVFRVLLQGWLEKVFSWRVPSNVLLYGTETSSAAEAVNEADAMPPAPGSLNPYAPSLVPAAYAAESPAVELDPSPRGFRAWLPIAISSLIFALMHWSHGPDWIPLTVLAIGLGYLYQRTHRILPSLIVHLLLNSFTLLALTLEVFLKPQP